MIYWRTFVEIFLQIFRNCLRLPSFSHPTLIKPNNLVSMKLAKLHEFGQASLKTNFTEVTIFLVLSK